MNISNYFTSKILIQLNAYWLVSKNLNLVKLKNLSKSNFAYWHLVAYFSKKNDFC